MEWRLRLLARRSEYLYLMRNRCRQYLFAWKSTSPLSCRTNCLIRSDSQRLPTKRPSSARLSASTSSCFSAASCSIGNLRPMRQSFCRRCFADSARYSCSGSAQPEPEPPGHVLVLLPPLRLAVHHPCMTSQKWDLRTRKCGANQLSLTASRSSCASRLLQCYSLNPHQLLHHLPGPARDPSPPHTVVTAPILARVILRVICRVICRRICRCTRRFICRLALSPLQQLRNQFVGVRARQVELVWWSWLRYSWLRWLYLYLCWRAQRAQYGLHV